ncbi:MAG: hypothetical protein GKR98_10555 [Boseongicola sp.]|nr:MAG: hypothetical protein GKR98_10555 [Boseongicola sp.]
MDISKTYDLPFAASVVFAAWVSPRSVISPATRIEVDPRPGGKMRVFVDHPGGTDSTNGNFLEFVTNERLRYTWEWNNDGEETEITVDFGKTDIGTRIILTHIGFQKDTSRDMHDAGWDSYVAGLTELLQSSED